MYANFTIPNDTFQASKHIDVWQYPGNPNIEILKRPQFINSRLLELHVDSHARMFDSWQHWPYGHAWQSPGYIDRLIAVNRSENKSRLKTLEQFGVTLCYLTPEEYVENYQSVYEQPYPDGVLSCEEEFDAHTVKRLRHLSYFKRHELDAESVSFVDGIGKLMGAGHSITPKQRNYIRKLFLMHCNFEHQILEESYDTLNKGTKAEYKLTF